jgi:hypothetical protein
MADDPNDACAVCMAEKCCGEIMACAADEACACFFECSQDMSPDECMVLCDLEDPSNHPPVMDLRACENGECGVECD